MERNNGSLVFNSVIASDEGSYDCQLTNNGSEFLVTSNTAELQIICEYYLAVYFWHDVFISYRYLENF